MLGKGVIRPSSSAWSAPAFLVPKRSPDDKPKFRFCVDNDPCNRRVLEPLNYANILVVQGQSVPVRT